MAQANFHTEAGLKAPCAYLSKQQNKLKKLKQRMSSESVQ
jgi:hypothetical protein